jgi:uncharacterized membrane protein YccC
LSALGTRGDLSVAKLPKADDATIDRVAMALAEVRPWHNALRTQSPAGIGASFANQSDASRDALRDAIAAGVLAGVGSASHRRNRYGAP